MNNLPLIVGISGASGVIYGVRMLEILRERDIPTHLVMSRAADVVLKERRRLVLMVRETPLHTGHLRSMTALSEMGAIIAPPVPAFYAKPQSLEDMVDHTLGRVLDLFDINLGTVRRWSGLKKKSRADAN